MAYHHRLTRTMAKYGSNIPLARELLTDLAQRIEDGGHGEWSATLRHIIAAHMYQSRPDKVTRVKHNSPTTEQRDRVLSLRAHTDLSQEEIAKRVGLNHGRVSEIIHSDKSLIDPLSKP